MKYAFMQAHREEFELKRMCRVLQVSRSGYYDWDRRKESKRSQQDRVLLEEIRRIHQQNQRGLRSDQDLAGVKPVRHGVRQASSGAATASGGDRGAAQAQISIGLQSSQHGTCTAQSSTLAFQSRSSRSDLGDRCNFHPDPLGVVVPGGSDRLVYSSGRRLVHEGAAEPGAGQ